MQDAVPFPNMHAIILATSVLLTNFNAFEAVIYRSNMVAGAAASEAINPKRDTGDVCRVETIGTSTVNIVSMNGSTMTFGADLIGRSLVSNPDSIRGVLATAYHGDNYSNVILAISWDSLDSNLGTLSGDTYGFDLAAVSVNEAMTSLREVVGDVLEQGQTGNGDFDVDAFLDRSEQVLFLRAAPAGIFRSGVNRVAAFSRNFVQALLPLVYAVGMWFFGYEMCKMILETKPGSLLISPVTITGTGFPPVTSTFYYMGIAMLIGVTVGGTGVVIRNLTAAYYGVDFVSADGGLNVLKSLTSINGVGEAGSDLTDGWMLAQNCNGVWDLVLGFVDYFVPFNLCIYWGTALFSTCVVQYLAARTCLASLAIGSSATV